ncbi:FAD-binding oxidoreductase [Pyrobaculum aerophilum]|uniref:FAD-binding oxidoreductase n=1 Tax=Pyrobaculum aerophilum TaxID=13773 RepID=UPI0023F172EC|nr:MULTISPECIES: FAD-linked oxidase C-terminal domain-containing protein [Pyrobaculum]MCX8136323.1 FAD-binding protein [Pyrobaculum aerophilum]
MTSSLSPHRALQQFIKKAKELLGESAVLYDEVDLLVYEQDGTLAVRGKAYAVVFPRSVDEMAKAVELAYNYGIPIVGRGSGTSLSGGATPIKGGVIVSTARMNKILEVDLDNEVAAVQAGVINDWVNSYLARMGYQYPIDLGYQYAADPGSQRVSTIGGNIAHNSGGVKCFKYGVTVNQLRGLTVVLPNGEVRRIGGKEFEQAGYDLIGLLTGSEGTLALVAEAVVRVVPTYETTVTIMAKFNDLAAAGRAVSAVIASGAMPVAMELMDKLAVEAVESGPYAAGLPRDAEAILLIQVEGSPPGARDEAAKVAEVLRRNGAAGVEIVEDPARAAKIWAARKQAFGAMGFVGPNYVVEDGTIPRKKLAEALMIARAAGAKRGLRVANVFHAGDGNLHPLILYDERRPGEREKAIEAGEEILEACVELGGTITGEHGVGYMKKKLLPKMYRKEEIELMKAIKTVFDPKGLMNPGKIFP